MQAEEELAAQQAVADQEAITEALSRP